MLAAVESEYICPSTFFFSKHVPLLKNSRYSRTSVANELSKRLGVKFADADDYHSETNKELMRAGIGLNDTNRLTWLKELRGLLLNWHRQGCTGVLACSSLKQKYRDLLNSGLCYDTDDNNNNNNNQQQQQHPETDINGNEIDPRVDPINLNLLFVLLNVDRELIERRLRERVNHEIIQNVSILDSQFKTLEMPRLTDNERSLLELDERNAGSYLCREICSTNRTSYLVYVLRCSSESERTVSDEANEIVNFLPKLQNLSKQINK